MSRIGLVVGLITGIIVGLVLVAIILKYTKTNKSSKCEFDERQESTRGKGYKYSFFTLVVYNLVYGISDMIVDKPFIDPFAAAMLGICVAVAVHVVYCIWRDAYFALNENQVRLYIAFVLIGVLNLGIGIVNILSGRVIVDGILTYRVSNLMCGILFIVIFLALLVKRIYTNKEVE